ncbi:hypothetical protein M0804_007660 [Polistes exclamans]|nr:hypothetical protein M0804_007660 [Polistes exclamans]
MSSKGRSCFEQHFLYSNPLVQFVLGISPYYNSNNKLFFFITVIVFLLPLMLHEVQLMILHIKYDYEQLSNEDEFNILEEYNKQTKRYTYCFVVIFHLYFVGIITPCILNIILYYVGVLENDHLTLPVPINKVLDPGIFYYSLLIYQTIAIYIFIILGSVCLPSYLSFVQHACCQFSIIRLKINEPFQKNKRSNQTIEWNKKLENEFDWIVDIIKRYTRVTDCQIPFYKLSIKTRKLLLFVIARSLRPCELSIGNLFASSHEVFSGVSTIQLC